MAIIMKLPNKVPFFSSITGEDGACLAEFLLDKGCIVHSLKHRTILFNTNRIDHLYYKDRHAKDVGFFLHHGDLTDSFSLIRIIQQTHPDEVYNLAAQSHVAVSFEQPEFTGNSDVLGALRLLGSQKITPCYSRSPYAVAKLYACWITINYREVYNLYACNSSSSTMNPRSAAKPSSLARLPSSSSRPACRSTLPRQSQSQERLGAMPATASKCSS